MINDIDVRYSDGWWMKRLWDKLAAEEKRFETLSDYIAGRPPLPWASENTKSNFYKFQKTSRTNFAELIVDAPVERIGIRSISTAAEEDVSGDEEAWKMLLANDLDLQFENACRDAKTYSRGYLLTQSPPDGGKYSIITSEDPRCFITEPDSFQPNTQRAAFKIFHDESWGLDVAILWRKGKKIVAVQERDTPPVIKMREDNPCGGKLLQKVSFNATGFTIRGERPDDFDEETQDPYWSEEYDGDPPVQMISNKNGVGEFEQHLDLLDRINHLTFMLLVTATMQAFRQRGLKQAASDDVAPLPEKDESGRLIDYDALFEAGPDAMWLLPQGADMWESEQADLQGSLSAIKNELLKLAAVTRTPMSLLTPDAIAQSAEGAQLSREGLVFKVEDFLRGAGRALSRAIADGFAFQEDDTRSDASEITVNFLPVERYSLAEKGSAAAQAIYSLPRETMWDVIWQLDPDQIRTAKTQWMQDKLEDQVLAGTGSAQPQQSQQQTDEDGNPVEENPSGRQPADKSQVPPPPGTPKTAKQPPGVPPAPSGSSAGLKKTAKR